MRRLGCPSCGAEIWFHNTACLSCGAELGFQPGRGLVPLGSGGGAACANRAVIGCNWVAAAPGGLCLSCAHSAVVPDLSVPGNDRRWARIERDKRMLMRLLDALGLPLRDAAGAPAPVFELRGDPIGPAPGPKVITGHAHGTITLNIAEADDAERERIRAEMGEPYRTLAGHLRHEVAHHYWDLLVAENPAALDRLRPVFGDERADYGAALERHYREGPPPGWEATHVTAYATAHPWEDFADTWAHLFHILDSMETALAYDLLRDDGLQGLEVAALAALPVERLAEPWIALSVALNAVNEAMGHGRFYPFVLSPAVLEKLEAIRRLLPVAG
ncbi:zinc-binding metallopeptidase family protein [Rhodovulum sulfidophilum]|uniref:zinc-binding metallopeptidase family protein n=1 Tax=Rhodovulum sulfidophilum TaxID=35806 RepID=UPI0019209F9F|nr:putative zinc-binding metallopeptidase [Rhodovulum sulfidophilum]MBL3562769.1 putative zinc-binding metallopeptidase [Rhodovulum sulfidophilum]